MRNISIIIDSSIKLNPSDLPKNILDEIFNKLTVPNPQKKIAEREMLWNAKNVPSHLKLWKYNGHNELIFPRGFYEELKNMLHNIIGVYYDVRTSYYSYYHFDVNLIPLREYQSKAIEKLAKHECGIYSAPTGSGKTRVMLELIRSLKQKTLVICEKTDIQEQWIKAASDFGFIAGKISGGEWNDSDLTIALRQSFTNINDSINDTWFGRWGMVVLDECHHASAETMFELLQRFPARYRYGCSATPDSDPDLFPIARAVIGPVVHETDIEEIGDHLIVPSVKVVKTEFEFSYRPTVRVGRKIVRNNYNELILEIQKNNERNDLICKYIANESFKGHKCLVVSDRIDHLEELRWKWHRIYNCSDEIGHFMLYGGNSNMFNGVKKEIEHYDGGYILFSTLAKEGTDIPILDRLFLTYPGRKLRGFEQSIGRIMRPHPKKKDAIMYDFRDAKVPILNSQYRYRAQNIYNKREYKVETL